MTDAPTDSKAPLGADSWSNRILLASVAGILFLTLYPFRFALSKHLPHNLIPFLLGGQGKEAGPFDPFLNVLLFVPYGFGLAEKLRGRKSWGAILGLTLASGALLSYAVEMAQFYIPGRDAGWEDVFTNSTGSALGFLLCWLCEAVVLRFLSACERAVTAFLTLRRVMLILLAYLGIWFAIAIYLQTETRLSNWSPGAFLVVGNGAPARLASPWKGEVLRLDIWDQAFPRESAEKLTSPDSKTYVDPAPRVSYDFSGSSPLQDRQELAPDLSWTPKAPISSDPGAAVIDGDSWLVTRGPVATLVKDFQDTRQFSVRIVCKPAQAGGMDGRIVSISQVSGPADLEIRQDESNLIFWFRNPLMAKRPRLPWTIPDVFAVNQTRDIVFSYDGSNLSVYVDGKEETRTYRFGPGTVLARLLRRANPSELEGYQYIFYALVFLPGGCLLGLAWRNSAPRSIGWPLLVVLGLPMPAVLLEIALVHVSGRAISTGNIVLAACLALAGGLWINADLGALSKSSVRRTQELAK